MSLSREEKTIIALAGAELVVIVLMLLWDQADPPAPTVTNLSIPVTVTPGGPMDLTLNLAPDVFNIAFQYPTFDPDPGNLWTNAGGPPCMCDCNDAATTIMFPDLSATFDAMSAALQMVTQVGLANFYDTIPQNQLWTANAYFSPWTPVQGLSFNYDEAQWAGANPGAGNSGNVIQGLIDALINPHF